MTLLPIVPLASAAGAAHVRRLEQRGRGLLEPELLRATAAIVDSVRKGGDRALLDAVRRYDGASATEIAELRLTPASDAADLPDGFAAALELAIRNIRSYQRSTLPSHAHLPVARGLERREQVHSLGRVGVYVPGGRASYPSTVLMTVLPAQIAGVSEIVVVTPQASWARNAALRFTLARLGVTEIWGLGGAHAVAALAYGTESIARVEKIVGPGNTWVTAAKYLVSAEVGIDSLAGPSEVLIVALGAFDPELVAADLLAQAEHDPQATAILVCDDSKLAEQVGVALEAQLKTLATAAVARQALTENGVALLVSSRAQVVELIERLAPEHLQLLGEAEGLAEQVRNAGAIFVGASTPEVFGDYLAGPSHVLPTAGTARFSSALGVEDFRKRSHLIRFSPSAAAAHAEKAAVLADVEGLPAHAAAARRRSRSEEASADGAESPARFVRPQIRDLKAYHLDLSPCAHKLDQNEMPFELPRVVKNRVAALLLERPWANYPDFHSDELRAALAAKTSWPANGILVGNGSNELLATALEALAGPGREVLGLAPSFGLYPMFCLRAGAALSALPAGADLRLPLAALAAEVEADPTRPLILCSPNNPTGEAIPIEFLDQLLSKLDAPLLLDNAYGEFCAIDYRPLLARHRHLLLFRTFSKAWSLGGLRLGYLLADPDLVTELIKVKLPYNVGFFGSLAGLAALQASTAAARRVAVIRGRRAGWQALLESHGFRVFPSEANFLLARVPVGQTTQSVLAALDARNIRVRDVSKNPGLGDCLRFSIGDGRALRAVGRALAELL